MILYNCITLNRGRVASTKVLQPRIKVPSPLVWSNAVLLSFDDFRRVMAMISPALWVSMAVLHFSTYNKNGASVVGLNSRTAQEDKHIGLGKNVNGTV